MTIKNKTAGCEPAAYKDQHPDYAPDIKKSQVQNDLLASALGFAKRGYAVFPVKDRDKTPLTQNGCKNASTDPAIIEKWWRHYPSANIGMATGVVSGVIALDVDGDDGENSLRKLEQQYGTLPHTVETITGGGGRHLFFKSPPEGGITNSAGKIGAGLDVRGDGGYVVVPPSIHKSGRSYEWSVDSHDEIAPAPDWLIRRIKEGASDAQKALPQVWCELIRNGVSEGKRNDAVARLSGKLFRCGVDPHLVLELCQAWNTARCRPPLSLSEVNQIVNSIAGRELARRRG